MSDILYRKLMLFLEPRACLFLAVGWTCRLTESRIYASCVTCFLKNPQITLSKGTGRTKLCADATTGMTAGFWEIARHKRSDLQCVQKIGASVGLGKCCGSHVFPRPTHPAQGNIDPHTGHPQFCRDRISQRQTGCRGAKGTLLFIC